VFFFFSFSSISAATEDTDDGHTQFADMLFSS